MNHYDAQIPSISLLQLARHQRALRISGPLQVAAVFLRCCGVAVLAHACCAGLGAWEVAAGVAAFVLPAIAMHSFQARLNREFSPALQRTIRDPAVAWALSGRPLGHGVALLVEAALSACWRLRALGTNASLLPEARELAERGAGLASGLLLRIRELSAAGASGLQAEVWAELRQEQQSLDRILAALSQIGDTQRALHAREQQRSCDELAAAIAALGNACQQVLGPSGEEDPPRSKSAL